MTDERVISTVVDKFFCRNSRTKLASTSVPAGRFVPVLRVNVYYEEYFPRSNQSETRGTIVLFHGFLSNSQTWSKCFQPLADETLCRVIAYDRLGFGFTERVLEKDLYTRRGELSMALDLFDKLQIEREVHLISNSAGAVVANDLAKARPDAVRSIIFIAPYGLVDHHQTPGAFSRFVLSQKPIQRLMEFGLKKFLPFRNAYFDSNLVKDPLIQRIYRKPVEEDPLFIKAFVLFVENYSASTENAEEPFQESQRVLIIAGGNDRILPRGSVDRFFSSVQSQRQNGRSVTELVTILRCGHLPQEENPEQLVQIVSHFIGRI